MRRTAFILALLMASAHLEQNHAFLKSAQQQKQQQQQQDDDEHKSDEHQQQRHNRWLRWPTAPNEMLFIGAALLVQQQIDVQAVTGVIAAAATAAAAHGEYHHMCLDCLSLCGDILLCVHVSFLNLN
jgi:hypothetical protein